MGLVADWTTHLQQTVTAGAPVVVKLNLTVLVQPQNPGSYCCLSLPSSPLKSGLLVPSGNRGKEEGERHWCYLSGFWSHAKTVAQGAMGINVTAAAPYRL